MEFIFIISFLVQLFIGYDNLMGALLGKDKCDLKGCLLERHVEVFFPMVTPEAVGRMAVVGRG